MWSSVGSVQASFCERAKLTATIDTQLIRLGLSGYMARVGNSEASNSPTRKFRSSVMPPLTQDDEVLSAVLVAGEGVCGGGGGECPRNNGDGGGEGDGERDNGGT